MGYFQPLLLLFLCLLFLSLQCSADDSLGNSCNDKTNLTSQTSSNLDRLLTLLVKRAEQSGFYATSYGHGSSQIYGLAQCRGDVSAANCSTCIESAAIQIKQACPTQSDAKIWLDFCFLRYSQDNFLGKVDTSGILYKNVESVSDPSSFKKTLGNVFHRIDKEAVQPLSGGLGKDQKKLSSFDTLYALVQCTEDLPPLYCAQCLAIGIQNFEGFCKDSKGCRVLFGSCYLRYELYPFFFPVDPKSMPHIPLNSRKYP